jgi:hypothetical protein
MMHTETIDPDDILKITKTRADIETKKKSIEDRKLALIKRSNSHKKLGSYSTVFYVLATVATIAVTAVTSFFPVFPTILNLLRDALVALPNLVAGTLWGVSISSSKKENLTKEKLKEQLAKAEDELQELEIQFEQLKNKKQIGTWWEAIEKQQDELQELEVQLDQLKNKNQIERPQTELSELSPAETGKKSSENHQLQDPEQDPKLITEKAKLKEIQGKLDENKKYKSSQRRWAIFSALFYIAAAAVMFSPLGPVLLAVGLTTALVVAALSLKQSSQ